MKHHATTTLTLTEMGGFKQSGYLCLLDKFGKQYVPQSAQLGN